MTGFDENYGNRAGKQLRILKEIKISLKYSLSRKETERVHD